MKRSKGTEGFLKAAVILCVVYAGIRAAEVIYNHIPPFSAGTCIAFENAKKERTSLTVYVKNNNLIEGTSDVEVRVGFVSKEGKASFQELREAPFKKVSCE